MDSSMDYEYPRSGQLPLDVYLRWEESAAGPSVTTNPQAIFYWDLKFDIEGYSRVELCELIYNEKWFLPFLTGGDGHPDVGIYIAELGNLSLKTSADSTSASAVTVTPTFMVPNLSFVMPGAGGSAPGFQQLGIRHQSQVKINPAIAIKRLSCVLTNNTLSVPTLTTPPSTAYYLYMKLRFYQD